MAGGSRNRMSGDWKMKNVSNELLDLTGDISRQNDKTVLAQHDTIQEKK